MSNEQKVGLFFVVGILLVVVAIEVTLGTGLLTETYRVHVHYPTVEGLRSGDAVQVAGVKLGRVDRVHLAPDGVEVTLQLNREAVVHRDAVARLDYEALSGRRFIAISLGTPAAGVLEDGGRLNGEVPPGITQMVDEMQQVARSIRDLSEALNENQERVLHNVNAMLEENRAAVRHALENVDSITAKLDRGEGTLARLLNDPSLYERADAIMADLRAVTERLANGQGDLGRLVSGDGALYDDVRETVASLNVTAANLEDISTRLRNGEGTLGRAMTDDSLYKDAEHAIRAVDRAATGIEDQSPISVLGTLVTTLF